MKELLPQELQRAAVEIAPYLVGSLGNYQRIDYGTGHEASLVTWLAALNRLNVVSSQDYTALVIRVFNRYSKISSLRSRRRSLILTKFIKLIEILYNL